MLVLALTAILGAAPRPTIAILPPLPEVPAAGDSWIGMAVADDLTQRLLVHSRFEPNTLQRVYPLNVFSWRQALSAARGDGIATHKPLDSAGRRRLLEQLGADYLFEGTYKASGAGAATLSWRITGERGEKSEKKPRSFTQALALDDLVAGSEAVAAEILRALGNDPKSVGGHKLKRLPLAAVKPYAQALEILGQQSLDPRAHLVLPIEDVRRAHQLLAAATDAAPDFVRAWVERGTASSMLGEHESAEAELVTAMSFAGELDPSNVLGLYYLYARQNKLDEAVGVLQQATDNHMGFLQGLGYLGQAYARSGQAHRAVEVFTVYQTRVPKSPWVGVQRAAALSRIGKHDNAIADTQAVLTKFPESLMVLAGLASRQIDARKLGDARDTLEKALALHGRHPLLLTRLSYIALEENKLAEARELAQKAVEAVGDGRGETLAGYAHMNLAHALGLAGEREPALKALTRAMELGVDSEAVAWLQRDARLKDLLADPRSPLRQEHGHH